MTDGLCNYSIRLQIPQVTILNTVLQLFLWPAWSVKYGLGKPPLKPFPHLPNPIYMYVSFKIVCRKEALY